MSTIHFLSMMIIGVGSFAFGILPMVFRFRMRSCPFFFSLILCLGAGVLLATSLVHMLTEVQERLKLYAQLYFCGGLFCLYIFDEISHYYLGIKKLEVHSVSTENQKRSSYGATMHSVGFSESSTFFDSNQIKLHSETNETAPNDKNFKGSHSHYECTRESQQNLMGNCSNSGNNHQGEVVCHSLEGEHYPPSSAAKTGLFISLFIHSILEGVSIGVQTEISQILLILGAVTFHKIVLSFCLGLELHYHKFTKLHLLVAISLFSIGSPLGILLGFSVTTFENGIFGIDDEMQAIAAGSLLYVALLEVLPRERFKWKEGKKGAGILQLIFLLTGFACIAALHFFFDFEFSSNDNRISNITRKFS